MILSYFPGSRGRANAVWPGLAPVAAAVGPERVLDPQSMLAVILPALDEPAYNGAYSLDQTA